MTDHYWFIAAPIGRAGAAYLASMFLKVRGVPHSVVDRDRACGLIVLTADGWLSCEHVKAEIEWFQRHGKPYTLMAPGEMPNLLAARALS